MLSVLQYAMVMDEIAKEIIKPEKGINIPNTNKKLGCLLWMDDVVLIAENQEELQEMLNITENIANKYHIVFGEEKSKAMHIKTRKEYPPTKLGEIKLMQTDKYKYLGQVINKKNQNNLTTHIEEVKRKAEAAYQTILTIAGDPTLKGIQLQTIWKLGNPQPRKSKTLSKS